MKCEICKCDTFVIHINEKHEKVCSECCQESEKNENNNSNCSQDK